MQGNFRALSSALGLCLAGLVSSCALIAGIEDAEVDPSFRPDGPGEPGGPGDGDGDGDHPNATGIEGVLWGPGSCSRELAITEFDIETALRIVGCDPEQPIVTASFLLTFGFLDQWQSYDCFWGATSCDEVESCLAREPLESEDFVECDATGWGCDDEGSAISCNGPYPAKYDCAALDGSCLVPSSFDAAFGCVLNDPIDCAEYGPGFHCNDDKLFSCDDGLPRGYQCPEGQSCVEGLEGVYCEEVKGACDELFTSSCSGNTLEFCNEDGLLFPYDCGTSGLSCVGESGFADCVADGCFSSFDCQETCLNERMARLCVGGAELEVDCTAFGFDSCVDDITPGPNGISVARCVEFAEGGIEPDPWEPIEPVGPPDVFIPRDDSCDFALNFVCDEPSGECALGTDVSDCNDTCPTSHNGVCDELTAACFGTDDTDCGYNGGGIAPAF